MKKNGIIHHTVKLEAARLGMSLTDLAKKLGIPKGRLFGRLQEPTAKKNLAFFGEALGHDATWLVKRCWEEYDLIVSRGGTMTPPRIRGEYIVPRP